MNLKKVIKENLDDLQWIRDIVGQTFNIGDTVICKPGFNKMWGSDDYGGAGYKEGRIFTIGKITEDGEILWPEPDAPYGVYTKAVELYSEEKMIKENDDLNWIKDVGPKDMSFRVGDIIKVHNIGDEDAFLNWLGDYSDDYVEGSLGENITGEIETITEERITIFESNTEEIIFFPTYPDIENLRSNHEDYHGLDMYYEIIG
jgi:hypothetical protein